MAKVLHTIKVDGAIVYEGYDFVEALSVFFDNANMTKDKPWVDSHTFGLVEAGNIKWTREWRD